MHIPPFDGEQIPVVHLSCFTKFVSEEAAISSSMPTLCIKFDIEDVFISLPNAFDHS